MQDDVLGSWCLDRDAAFAAQDSARHVVHVVGPGSLRDWLATILRWPCRRGGKEKLVTSTDKVVGEGAALSDCRCEPEFTDPMRPKLFPHLVALEGAGLAAEKGPLVGPQQASLDAADCTGAMRELRHADTVWCDT